MWLWLILSFVVVLFALFTYWQLFVLRAPQPKSVRLELPPGTMPAEEMNALPSEQKFCVIGAGFSGLAVAAAFKRNNIPYEQIELDKDIGGNWFHGVYETVHIISSKKTTEYSDFPMPEEYSDFPSAKNMLDYFHSYADHFQLWPHIRLNTEVANVYPAENQFGDAGWDVHFGDGTVKRYQGVIVANGHHWDKRMPEYPGNPTMEIIHSKDYKSPEKLKGKRVLVIGGGNSACDIAVEAARFAVSSSISLRRGYWFVPRSLCGKPMVEMMIYWMPLWAQRILFGLALWLTVGKYSNYGLEEPDHKIFEHHPTVNSELLHYIKLGEITPHKDIKCYDGKTVEFVDGKKIEVDLVVCATGYHIGLPMIKHLVEYKGEVPQLLFGMMLEKYRNLFVFGVGQARYGAGPLYTAGADLLVQMVGVQKRLGHPIGAVVKKLGGQPVRAGSKSVDILIDPHESFGRARLSRLMIPTLPFFEKFLMPAYQKAKND